MQEDQALKQMQGKVANMQNAFKGSVVLEFTVAASVVAVLSTGLGGLACFDGRSAAREAVTLSKKVEKLGRTKSFISDSKSLKMKT